MFLRNIAAICSFVLGSLGLLASANAEDTPGFLLVNATVTDFKKLGAYGQALPPVYAKHNGEYVIFGGIGRGIEVINGSPSFESVIFARFDTKEAVENFWWSDDYRAVFPLREGAGRFDVVGLAGTGAEPYQPTEGVQPAYVLTYVKIKDFAKMGKYVEQVRDYTAQSPARLIALVRPDDMAILEGPKPEYTVEIASWPSVESYEKFISDPIYQAAIPNRDEAMELLVMVAEVPAPPQ